MSNSAKATIQLKIATQKQLSTILNALTPEANAPLTRRAKIKLEKKDSFLLLKVEAEDTVALRATLNTYLRWINSTVNVMNAVENV